LFIDIFSQICDQNGHMVAWKFREYLQEVLVLPSAVYESPSFHYSDQISAEIFSGVKYILVITMDIFFHCYYFFYFLLLFFFYIEW